MTICVYLHVCILHYINSTCVPLNCPSVLSLQMHLRQIPFKEILVCHIYDPELSLSYLVPFYPGRSFIQYQIHACAHAYPYYCAFGISYCQVNATLLYCFLPLPKHVGPTSAWPSRWEGYVHSCDCLMSPSLAKAFSFGWGCISKAQTNIRRRVALVLQSIPWLSTYKINFCPLNLLGPLGQPINSTIKDICANNSQPNGVLWGHSLW